ncbi:MAG: peptidoglycan editing factor PgeF [Zetaproteobacteria bacterium]|nr:MAG: peptidoglycan editing factor PgeF [Zetaproteobacteria bacterium]
MHLIRSHLLAEHGFTGIFTTRQGGVSPPPTDSLNFAAEPFDSTEHVAENLALLKKAVPLSRDPLRVMQVHGTDMLSCHHDMDPSSQRADALLTDEPDLPLAVQTADCLPILLADPGTGLMAAVHAGWRGTAGNILGRVATRMVSLGADANRLLACMGPCIGACCFAIDRATAEQLLRCSPDAQQAVRLINGTWHADLVALNRYQLLALGVHEAHIETLDSCTSCHPRLFFSHRRDRGRTGRHLAIVARPVNP